MLKLTTDRNEASRGLFATAELLVSLCLLDLSAAFDTVDHDILLTRLSSWFGIHGTALNWFRSYISSRRFRVKCNNDFSSPHTCLCGVPQGSILGPLLFVMYTTPLSTLVSSLALNHHLYADDTQLFFSFHPSDFHSNISHLQYALQQISSWMTANLLTFDSSKTEFLLIGLKQQLSKIQDCSLSLQPTPLAILVLFLKNTLPSRTKSPRGKNGHFRPLSRFNPGNDTR